ncbi:MAG: bifunctional diguanylate cyclase/phosphodiesterase [Methylotenera sp.]
MIIKSNISRFTNSFWLTLGLLVIFPAVFVAYIHSEKQIDRANELRLQSHLLADELRQSSDDLTRMVRTYIVTGDPIYKQHYQEILDIRDGKKPRPVAYNDIYWDLVLADDLRPRGSEQALPLLELMRHTGFTETEFAKLAQAKSNSDALTTTEFAAMKLVESADPTIETSRAKANQMLNNLTYHTAKAEIMRPLNEFHQMMNKRTLDAVRDAEATASLMRLIVILLGLLLAFMLWLAYRALNTILGSSIDELYAHIAEIGSGKFTSAIPIRKGMENSVLGWLSETQIKLAQIDSERKVAEARTYRQTQLYAALSQCNQAIVRCSNEAELFPQICRDAVIFGGMKMAWIGLFDEQSQLLKPVASFGTGIGYLQKLKISVDANDRYGRGPTGTAFRENHASWCLDFMNDPDTEAWHELGAQYGWKASAALPLHRNGVVIGTFNIYAQDANVFDQAGCSLLLEMAADIDHALDHFKMESERVLFKEKLLESEERSRLVLENSLDAIINMDENGLVIEWSGAAVSMFGYERDEAIGHTVADLIIPARDRDAHYHGMHRQLTANEFNMIGKRFEVNALRSDGSEFPVEMSIARIHRDQHILFSAFIRDISERKQAEKRIQHLAHFDALTGLPNRSNLQDHLNYALSLVKRNNGKLAVMFLDLDHFKDINDTLGHSVGDALLVELANRLQLTLREEDTVSRLGGDEFILMLPGTDARGAAHVSQKLLNIIAEPYRIEPYELTVTGSIGIALYPDDGADLETLSRNADAAMYRAKREGRNGYRFFTTEMQERSSRNLQLVNALRHALDRNQLEVHYQPQFSLREGRIVGAEALLRWQHPELGSVSPAEFIPVAEDSGLILQIGEWALRQAVQQAKNWIEDGFAPIVIAVNLSVVQFRHPDLPNLVTRILSEVGLSPEYLELELTEGVAMHDPQAAIAVMNNLHECGIRMSIDDFGTGYSSLNYLKKFKVYKLKIDQSFVRDISTDPEDKAIVSAIINMAHSLGLHTIAEGVETAEQLAFLREQGCDEAQGHYYSVPLPAAQFDKLVRASSQKTN